MALKEPDDREIEIAAAVGRPYDEDRAEQAQLYTLQSTDDVREAHLAENRLAYIRVRRGNRVRKEAARARSRRANARDPIACLGSEGYMTIAVALRHAKAPPLRRTGTETGVVSQFDGSSLTAPERYADRGARKDRIAWERFYEAIENAHKFRDQKEGELDAAYLRYKQNNLYQMQLWCGKLARGETSLTKACKACWGSAGGKQATTLKANLCSGLEAAGTYLGIPI